MHSCLAWDWVSKDGFRIDLGTHLTSGNLKLLVSEHFGYGNGVSRSPLPSGSTDAVKVAEKMVNDLVKREKAL